jgi:hypothetical protein
VSEVLLLDAEGKVLGGATFSVENNAWTPLMAFVLCGICILCDRLCKICDEDCGNICEEIVDIVSGLCYTVDNGVATITGFDGNNYPKNLVLPETIGGYDVVGIAAFAFEGTAITTVSIPSGVRTIGVCAFYTTALENIVFEQGVYVTVGMAAFANNANLASINFNSRRANLGGASFVGNPQLNTVLRAENVIIGESGLTMQYESRLYTNATLNNDFNGSRVIVMLDRSIQGINKVHCPSFFGDFPIAEIIDLTWHDSTEAIERTQQDIRSFRQVLKIILPFDCKENVLAVIRQLEQVDGIFSAEPDFYLRSRRNTSSPLPINRLGATDFDFYFDEHYYFDDMVWDNVGRIRVPEVHSWLETRGVVLDNVMVGIVDSGIAVHPSLENYVRREYGGNFVEPPNDDGSPTGDSFDLSGHGTQTAGVVRAVAENALLIPLKVTEGNELSSSDVARAIRHANAMGIPILNFSDGWTISFNEHGEAIPLNGVEEAIRDYNGLLIAAAAHFDETPDYLASLDLSNVIVVGASDSYDMVADRSEEWPIVRSSYCPETVHLFAPGLHIRAACVCRPCTRCDGSGERPPCGDCWECNMNGFCVFSWCDCTNIDCLQLSMAPCAVCISCTSNGQCIDPHYYCLYQNTSAAAPHVAGVVALLYAWYQAENGSSPCRYWLKEAILNGVDSGEQLVIPYALNGKAITNGRLNAYRSLQILHDIVRAMECGHCNSYHCVCLPCEFCPELEPDCICDYSTCGDWRFFENHVNHMDTTIITEYRGMNTHVIIPSEFNGIPVLRFNVEVFRGNGTLTSIVIPESITNIGEGAFRDCVSLETVTFRRTSLPRLGFDIFFGSNSISTMYIPFRTTIYYEEALMLYGVEFVEICLVLECGKTYLDCECEPCLECRRETCICCKRPNCGRVTYVGHRCIGNVTGEHGKEPGVSCAIAILRHLVSLPSVLDSCDNAFWAALITSESQTSENADVQSAIAILRYIVNLTGRNYDKILNDIWRSA